MQLPQALVVLVTTVDAVEAERLARVLLDRRLIACANVVPQVRSLFHWENRLECAEESLLIMKTTADALAPLTAEVKRLHSYDIPEVIALPVVGGSAEYLSWVAEEIHPATLDDA